MKHEQDEAEILRIWWEEFSRALDRQIYGIDWAPLGLDLTQDLTEVDDETPTG